MRARSRRLRELIDQMILVSLRFKDVVFCFSSKMDRQIEQLNIY